LGPVKSFPFDAGENNLLVAAVEDGRLAYISVGLAEDLDGTVEFVNAGFAAHGSGRTLGNRVRPSGQYSGPRAAKLGMKLDTIAACSGARVLAERAADRAPWAPTSHDSRRRTVQAR
jgi:hypothetical protein